MRYTLCMTHARPFIALASLLLLCACVQQIDYRAGMSTAEVNRIRDACTLQALNQAPVNTQTRVLPGRFIPERQICDANGNCTIRPAYQEFPRFETYDANTQRRALLTRTCLSSRGIDRVSLPYCEAAVKSQVEPGITRVLPPLTEGSCIIPRGSGAYQIVTR
ncbi:hypothetical protein [Pseudooceanicola sp.]|uniref:hypothetical protein n=1 Tax=Pseudooceanicola sp. TaxID=1914328 RepID=UPI0035C67F6C